MSTSPLASPALPGPEEAKALLHELAGPFLRRGPVERGRPRTDERLTRQDVSAFQPLEALFGSLPDVLPDALIVVDPRGLMVLANRQTAELFGYLREELLGAPVELLIPESYRHEHVEKRQGYFKAPRTRPMAASLRLFGVRKDGSEFPVEISLSPFQTALGLVVVSTIRDVSERVRLEKRYRTLIEGIPAVTFLAALDAGLSELYVSPQIEKLLGFSQEEWLGDPILWYRQLHPEDQARWHSEFARTCATGGPFRAEYRFVARDGRVVWVLGEAKVVCSDDGRPLFMQGIAFDITPMKQAEEQLRAHQQNLERLVSERTNELQEEQLKLKEKIEELKYFTHFAGHELARPLRIIVDEMDLPYALPRGRQQPAVRELTDWVKDKAEYSLERIDAMLRWAKVAEGQQRLVPFPCELAFARACDLLGETIAATRATVTCGPLPRVLAGEQNDRDKNPQSQLFFLFENLINNALKYRSPERPPVIRAEARRHGDSWEFSFQDNGIGIEARYYDGTARTQIFDIFKRLHTESKIPGHGIGLAYCKRVVENLGGKIWVESVVGQGSTFRFTLPVLVDDRAGETAGTAPASTLEPPSADAPASRARSRKPVEPKPSRKTPARSRERRK